MIYIQRLSSPLKSRSDTRNPLKRVQTRSNSIKIITNLSWFHLAVAKWVDYLLISDLIMKNNRAETQPVRLPLMTRPERFSKPFRSLRIGDKRIRVSNNKGLSFRWNRQGNPFRQNNNFSLNGFPFYSSICLPSWGVTKKTIWDHFYAKTTLRS